MRLDYYTHFLHGKILYPIYILLNLRSKIKFFIIKRNTIDLFLENYNLTFVASFLKLNSLLRFQTLVDISVVDFPEKFFRFKLVYSFLSSFYSKRVNLISFLPETNFQGSLTKIFSSANWQEREVWDMYGIFFLNHGDLRRILTDYGFKGYPLKKDFPLTGYIQLRHDDTKGDIVYEPVKLAQELRFFNFSTGWEQDQ